MAYNKTFHKWEGNVCTAKECTVCREVKPASEYLKIATTRSGLRSRCNKCYTQMFRDRRKRPDVKEKERIRLNEWRRKNRDKTYLLPSYSKYRSSQKAKETKLLYTRKNRGRYNQINAERRELIEAAKVHFHFEKEIAQIYLQSHIKTLETGITHSVDHIIPIKNKNVCGLHVPWNMQILTKVENSSKRNRFDGTYENESWRKSYQKLIERKLCLNER